MIIDVILDRKDDEKLIEQGYTHIRLWDGTEQALAYDPHRFYRDIIGYGRIGDNITRAMDYGTEEDVKNALCQYIKNNEYNPKICDYINSRTWLTST